MQSTVELSPLLSSGACHGEHVARSSVVPPHPTTTIHLLKSGQITVAECEVYEAHITRGTELEGMCHEHVMLLLFVSTNKR